MRRIVQLIAVAAAIVLAGTSTVTRGQTGPQGRVIVVPTVSVPTVSVPTVSVAAAATDPCTLPAPLPTQSTYTSGPPGLPGYFDSTFGSGGKVIGPRFTSTSVVTRSSPVAIDHASRIIVVGSRNFPCTRNNTTREMIAARYLPDGTPDDSFGIKGLVAIAFAGGSGGGGSVAVQADGKIVIGGQASQAKSTASLAVIVRLNQSGSLDTSFGKGGYFWFSPWGTKANSSVVSLTLQSAGSAEKIVAAGWSDYGPRFVLRLNANGALDGSFNGSGYSLLNVPNVSAVRIQSVDGSTRIVVVGWTKHSYEATSHYLGAVWRFMDSGVPDNDFGGGRGFVETSFHDDVEDRSFGDTFHSVAIDGANRIVAVGAKAYSLLPGDHSTSRNQLVLARYDVSGNLDPSFGSGGKVWVPLSARGRDIGNAVAVQGDGRIIVSGYTYEPHAAVVRRLNADGSIDASFGDAGSNTDAMVTGARLTYASGMAIQPDGRIVCAGYVAMPGSPQINYIVLARYWQ